MKTEFLDQNTDRLTIGCGNCTGLTDIPKRTLHHDQLIKIECRCGRKHVLEIEGKVARIYPMTDFIGIE